MDGSRCNEMQYNSIRRWLYQHGTMIDRFQQLNTHISKSIQMEWQILTNGLVLSQHTCMCNEPGERYEMNGKCLKWFLCIFECICTCSFVCYVCEYPGHLKLVGHLLPLPLSCSVFDKAVYSTFNAIGVICESKSHLNFKMERGKSKCSFVCIHSLSAAYNTHAF